MDIKEKLRQAALEAECQEVKKLPADDEILWVPSEGFQKNIEEIVDDLKNPSAPVAPVFAKKRKFRFVYVLVAVLMVIAALSLLPLMQRGGDFITDIPEETSSSVVSNANSEQNDSKGEENTSHESESTIVSDTSEAIDEISSDEVSGVVSEDSFNTSGANDYFPSYLPNGYYSAEIKAEIQGVLEFTDGKNKILLEIIGDEISLTDSMYQDLFIHENQTYYVGVPAISDNVEAEDSKSNNLLWCYEGKTFVLYGNPYISQEELKNVAISIDLSA
jgi:hypothetical protein